MKLDDSESMGSFGIIAIIFDRLLGMFDIAP